MSSQEIKIVPHQELIDKLANDSTFFDRLLITYIDKCDFTLTEHLMAIPVGSIQLMLAADPEFNDRFVKAIMASCAQKTVFMLPAVINAISSTLVDGDADARTVMSAVSKHGELMLRLHGKSTRADDKKDGDELDDIYKDLESRT